MRVTPITSPMTNKTGKTEQRKHDADAMPKPLIDIPEDTPDDTVVMYSSCGPNYVFPITAGQIREKAKMSAQTAAEQAYSAQSQYSESNEKYTRRKLHSTEWTL